MQRFFLVFLLVVCSVIVSAMAAEKVEAKSEGEPVKKETAGKETAQPAKTAKAEKVLKKAVAKQNATPATAKKPQKPGDGAVEDARKPVAGKTKAAQQKQMAEKTEPAVNASASENPAASQKMEEKQTAAKKQAPVSQANMNQAATKAVPAAEKQKKPAEDQKTAETQQLQESPMSVTRAAICTSVENREPQGEAASFPSATSKLYCFSHVRGAQGESEIRHTWYHNEDALGSVSLDVRSSSWRTYSSKTIPQGYSGDWKVEIADAASGKVLKTLSFVVE